MADYEKVRAALSDVPLLHEGFHGKIYEQLKAAGCFGGGISASSDATGISRLEAAMQNPQRRSAWRHASGLARRHNIRLPADGEIDLFDLNDQLTNRGVSAEKRMELKHALHCAGLLPD